MMTSKALNPSSNWRALQKKLGTNAGTADTRAAKRRKLDNEAGVIHIQHAEIPIEIPRGKAIEVPEVRPPVPVAGSSTNLAEMILHCDEESFSEAQRKPGKYLAVDCEMVGVGPEGEESSLARVSMVNYHGSVQLDIFVKQREKVTDWRTAVSGIHPHHMSSAVPFSEAQIRVADLIKDRILIGHAIENDLKALLLSHPRNLVRDTQKLARQSKLLGGSRWPGLKKLIQKEFDITIQAGQHDSVTDARATMALFRKHRDDWEKLQRPMIRKDSKSKSKAASSANAGKEDAENHLERVEEEEESLTVQIKSQISQPKNLKGKPRGRKRNIDELESHPGAGVKGFSSGLTTIVRRRDSTGGSKTSSSGSGSGAQMVKKAKAAWWATIKPSTGGKTGLDSGGGKSAGSKGSLKLQMSR